MSLDVRSLTPELMDEPGLADEKLFTALQSLNRMHTITFVARQIWRRIETWAKETGRSEISVLDVASGGGGMLRSLAQRAADAGYTFRGLGLDINPRSVAFARSGTPARYNIEFKTGDALRDLPN